MTMTMVQSWGGPGSSEEDGEEKLPRVMSVNRMGKEKKGEKEKSSKPKSPGGGRSRGKTTSKGGL